MEADYVTVLGTHDPYRFLVCVMEYRARDEEFIPTRCSQPLTHVAAKALAQSWAAAKGLEVR